jgi:hypothetical protein
MQLKKLNQQTVQKVHNVLSTKAARLTQIALIIVFAGLVIWDIYLFIGEKPTISRVIHDNSQDSLFVISWIWGVISTHLFVAKKKGSATIHEGIAILILLLISIIIFLLGKYVDVELPQYMHILFLVFGAITGYHLWPQKLQSE